MKRTDNTPLVKVWKLMVAPLLAAAGYGYLLISVFSTIGSYM
jgi:hypothetical protein